MNLFLPLIIFAIGIVLVIRCGDLFVDKACFIAKAFGIQSFIIGATIVSIATTIPELIVSIIAAGNNQIEMALGNSLGSVSANTGLILGIIMIFMNIKIDRHEYILQCVLLMAATGILFVSSQDDFLNSSGAAVLFLLFVVFMIRNVAYARKNPDPEDTRPKVSGKKMGSSIALFILGAVGITIGSQLLIDSGTSLAELFHVPERIIAITMIAIGTSLPELVTAITSIAKHETSLSIGNLIGASIIDVTIVPPICSLIAGRALPVSEASSGLDMPVSFIITMLAFIPILIRRKTSKILGVLLLAVYAAYICFTLL